MAAERELTGMMGRLVGQLRQAFALTRAQIDRTGLFPDLKGAAGRKLRDSVAEEGGLTKSYMLMCGLSAGIATLGLLQSSTAVVIGAMLISPLMGPIASMGFAFASIDGHRIKDSLRVIAIGAAIGILTGIFLTWLSPIRNATPEIIARTEPTLLDLAIAILSGVAGAYATVRQKGATAIGVAIATALMPPLATVGYGLGVFNLAFAGGAFLLFLTNLAAIGFSFALVARFSGAARPLANVEITPRYVVLGVLGFLLLAAPLGLTLYRVTNEAGAQSAARRILQAQLHIHPANIAQLQVKWPIRGDLSIDAVVVAPTYRNDADVSISAELERALGKKPKLNLQQIVAADIGSQTRAIVDAAVERSAAGIARDVPPLAAIREAVGLPTQALWANRSERTVQIVPYAAPGWTLADYRAAEQDAAKSGSGWQVRVIPPVQARLFVAMTVQDDKRAVDEPMLDAIWAVQRWSIQNVPVEGVVAKNATDDDKAQALANAQFVVAALRTKGIIATPGLLDVEARPERSARQPTEQRDGVEIVILRRPKHPANTSGEQEGDGPPGQSQ